MAILGRRRPNIKQVSRPKVAAVQTFTLSDTGTGSDALTVPTEIVPLAEAGHGADIASVSYPWVGAHLWAGTDPWPGPDTSNPLSETGVGADALTVKATVPVAETVASAGTFVGGAAINVGNDPATGVDAFTVTLRVVSLTETCTAQDVISGGHPLTTALVGRCLVTPQSLGTVTVIPNVGLALVLAQSVGAVSISAS